MSATDGLSFATHFWGNQDQGVGVLISKLQQSQQTLVELQHYFSLRANIEEEYGKKLVELSQNSLAGAEMGSLKSSLGIYKQEIGATGESHKKLAEKIRAELEKATSDFVTLQMNQRKEHTNVVEQTVKNKANATAEFQRLKDRYEMNRANQLAGRPNSTIVSEQELQEAGKRLDSAQKSFASDWRRACEKFQGMEEERIDFIRNILWRYTNLLADVCVTDDQSYERVRKVLEQCDIDADVAAFIKAKGTGVYGPSYRPPPPPQPAATYATQPSPPTSYGHTKPSYYAQQPAGYPQAYPPQPYGGGYPPHPAYPGQASSAYYPPQPVAYPPIQGGPYPPSGYPPNAGYPPQQQQQQPSPQHQPAMFRPAGIQTPPSHPTSYQPQPQSNPVATATTTSPPVSQHRPLTESSATQPGNPSVQSTALAPPNTAISDAGKQPTKLKRFDSIMKPAPAPEKVESRPVLFYGIALTFQRCLRKVVKAMYDYDAETDEELSFKEGQVISVLGTNLDGWYDGQISVGNQVKIGLFPSNFTEPLTF